MKEITVTMKFTDKEAFNLFHLSLVRTSQILQEQVDHRKGASQSLYWQLMLLEQVFFVQESLLLDIEK